MGKNIFRYLIPIYIIWFFVHILFFFRFIFSQIGRETPDISGMAILFISHFLVIIAGIAFMIYMLIDCALRKFNKDTDKVVWIIIIVLFSIIGAIIYYYVHGYKLRK